MGTKSNGGSSNTFVTGTGQLRRGPWRVLAVSLAGLVLAIAVVGTVGLVLNQSLHDTTRGALVRDIALQDDADDFRVAILEVRHYQRNLMFYGPTDERLMNFRAAYVELLSEIGELEALGQLAPDLPAPEVLRQWATEYNDLFSPALTIYESDPDTFESISLDALARLEELEASAEVIDDYAEREADIAVARIEAASENARLVLIVVIGGLILVDAGLIYATIRVLREINTLYAKEQQASSRLTLALQAKNNFIADASHELRTPLTVLRGNAEAGLAIEPNCGHREILEDIVEESSTMTRLVDDLLFLARSDASAPPLDTELVPVKPLLETIAERSEVLARQRGIEFASEIDVRGSIQADASRIEQAILALVDNAAKFSFPGGMIRLSTKVDGDVLTIDVSDQGPGIAEEELPHIFERFYLVDRARNRRRGGAGLGLSIAKTIVEAHGGSIDVLSKLGYGTRMRVRLPLATMDVAAELTTMRSSV